MKNDSPICNYSCEQNKCDFTKALLYIKENVDIKALGSQKVLEEVGQEYNDTINYTANQYYSSSIF